MATQEASWEYFAYYSYLRPAMFVRVSQLASTCFHLCQNRQSGENGDRNPVFTRVLVSKSFIPILFMHRTFRLFENNVRVEYIISNSAPRVWPQEFCYFIGNCNKLFSNTSTELINVEKERSSSFCLPSIIYLV